MIRRQKGGAAVVLGALSPRTRNAQVAMYQAGEVEYLVATDAIGMGLNMDVAHVAFAKLAKFDGHRAAPAAPAEMAQIAGRAGRHMADGTFGATDELEPFDAGEIEAVESHSFAPLKRSSGATASSTSPVRGAAAPASSERPPAGAGAGARRRRPPALVALSRDDEIARLATNREAVRLLWQVCQIPDFRKMLTDAHLRLLARSSGT